jgi:lsr operon transcriptional repressor
MLGRIAALYYTHGLTHQAIGDLLGLSRVQVTRLLAKARQEGIVEIKIHSEEAVFPETQLALERKFNLAQAWVGPSFADPERTLDSVGAVGANFLVSTLKPGDIVAVGLSITLEHIVPHLKGYQIDATFVPALGSRPSSQISVSPHEVASSLAEMAGGRTRHLPAPFLMASEESAEVIRKEPDVRQTLEMARKADLGLYGLGGTKPGTGPLVEALGITGELEKLLKGGAVGDMSGIYFDKDGKYVKSSADKRVIGLTLEDIWKLPKRAIVASGRKKVEAIAAAARCGLITHLITDLDTAEALLAY